MALFNEATIRDDSHLLIDAPFLLLLLLSKATGENGAFFTGLLVETGTASFIGFDCTTIVFLFIVSLGHFHLLTLSKALFMANSLMALDKVGLLFVVVHTADVTGFGVAVVVRMRQILEVTGFDVVVDVVVVASLLVVRLAARRAVGPNSWLYANFTFSLSSFV